MAGRLAALRGRIDDACSRADREPAGVTLLAVSKTFPAEAVQEAYAAGQRCFGESRQQEAAPKIEALPADIEWHFIGGLQRNKARKVVAAFPVIHSVDSLRLAEYLDRVASEEGKRPQIYLEVNIASEASKGGFSPDELVASAAELAALRQVEIAGLMAIPPDDAAAARRWFAATRELRDRLRKESGLALPGLSMGMSADFEDAVLEGSTVVRVGSALFGYRPYPA
ncbi:YggS family pyridoxal phosphate-dependent enzyme [Luteolibacter arcticus]|uniref:Pyridoxal phosphate homeostasis protein n=1 Tax=Luteolibacter arcticus TaxID=1581411 RepID=A0ABT3GMW3_9BACT|nr:YggS family pyridoxal phosphate-dependent enzyme [Luteolibacter arcticus]MCW1924843.1 YggS family pyridoxal phosphate-dependent enzyme [Luteolibacter arcticus]